MPIVVRLKHNYLSLRRPNTLSNCLRSAHLNADESGVIPISMSVSLETRVSKVSGRVRLSTDTAGITLWMTI